MKPKYQEKIEIVPGLDGRLFCVLTWQEHSFQEVLPIGVQSLPEWEFKRYLQQIIPRLRLRLLKLQKGLLEMDKVDPEDLVPRIEFSKEDLAKLKA